MKKIISSAFLCLFAFIATAQQLVVDPNAQVRTLTGAFKAIKISGGIDLYLSQSDNETVAVSASENKYLDDIKTVVENDVLKISVTGKNWVGKNKNYKVYVSFKDIAALDVSGASDVKVSGTIKVSSLVLNMSGSSDFTGAVNINSLSITLSGASDVKISGKAALLSIESSGASDVKGKGLVVETCTANASGASDINITVTKEINATASGASSIHYYGNATAGKMVKTGASTIEKKG